MRARRALVALTVPVMALLGLTACQSGGTATPAAESPSVGAPAEVEPAAELLTVADLDGRTRAASQAASSVHMTMTIAAEGMTMTSQSDVVLAGPDVRLHQVTQVDGQSMEMIVVDGMFYLNLGEQTGGLYVALDPAAAPELFGGSADVLTGEMDPAALFGDAREAIVSFEPDGDPVTLDGVQAQPYVIVMDTAKVATLASALLPTGQVDPTDATAGMPAELTYHLWVGVEDDLIRKVTADLGVASMEALYSGWGSDVQITAPPADQVTTMDL